MIYLDALKVIAHSDEWQHNGSVQTAYSGIKQELIRTHANGQKQVYLLTKREVSKVAADL